MSYHLLISVRHAEDNELAVGPTPVLFITVGDHIDDWISAFKCFLLAAQFPQALVDKRFVKGEDDVSIPGFVGGTDPRTSRRSKRQGQK